MILYLLVLITLTSCRAAEVCYPPCGCFNDDFPFDARPLPDGPIDQGLEYRLYTVNNPTIHVVMDLNGPPPAEYDPSKPTKFLIHGWNGNGDNMVSMKDAFLGAGFDYNVVSIDWSVGGGYIWYPRSASNTRVVGACTAHLSRQLVQNNGAQWSDMHCIGLSLGGQACGYYGKSSNSSAGRLSGLDPAGPWFTFNDSRLRIDKDDAQFVDITHTNVDGDIYLGLGTKIGHVDFYPNEGSLQPPCGGSAGCDHTISQEYYRISIAEAALCTFSAYPCDSKEDGANGQCRTCQAGVDCQRMGYYSNTMPGRGSYWLATTDIYPYCED